ncbi:probable U3 small nucleolar RNA-associated protein 11 [Cicer arietinum]|uniref:Probable U3 small nucleolar RNA-associated protein 11 n=1 Tax=Cicer arietinum TaxID=3827 RepID=A0A1S2XSG9_CICAR|nr:probable U3 small nucleolar RNA-associated protein 11 [Cicer arietinum]
MTCLRKVFRRRTYKERAQPASREKFGLLEKHKDYVQRAKAFHKKKETLEKLREKAANRNPDEFYFKMTRARLVDGVHTPHEANEYYIPVRKRSKASSKSNKIHDKDMGHLLHKIQDEKKKIERLNATLHSLGIFSTKERKTDRTNKELKESRTRLRELEKLYTDKTMQEETQKKGRKRKLCERKR